MCPSAPVPSLPALLDISDSSSDEELVRFVVERKAGEPLPQNVMTGLDLSAVDPWDTSENIWYLNRSDEQQPYDKECGEIGIRKTTNGYWQPVGAFRIPTSTAIVGMKVSLEFYEGQAPSGQRTRWMMHEYQAEEKEEGANNQQDYKSLCRVFLQKDKRINAEEQESCLNAEIEDQNAGENSKIVAANEPNVSSRNGQDEQIFCNEHYIEMNDLLSNGQDEPTNCNEDYIEINDLLGNGQDEQKTRSDDVAAPYDFSNEDYIEINDLLSSEASSSSSENSSKRSLISDGYFDSGALLREIMNDHNTTDEGHPDCKCSVTAPTTSDHVVVSPSEQGSVQSLDNNAMAAGPPQEIPVPADGTDLYSALPSAAELQQHNPSTSACSSSSHVKRNRSNSSQSSTKSPRGERLRSPAKFVKIGRKYCCFGSF